MPTTKTSHPIGIKIYSIDNALLEGATVTLTLGTSTTSGITNSNGQVVLNVANAGDWSVGGSVSITATKTGSGRKTSTLILTSSPQQMSMTLEETSDLYYEENDSNVYVLNFAIIKDYAGNNITTANPFPVKTQDPLAGYHSTDIARTSPEYHGYLNKDGGWYIVQYNRSTGARRFARGSSDYAANFTNRANLAYSYFNEVF